MLDDFSIDSIDEMKDIWREFEKEWHMGPGYHLCASDVPKFLDFLKKKLKEKEHG